MNFRQGYIDDQGVGHILLTRGKEALCDAHWFHILSQFNWHVVQNQNRKFYAVRFLARVNGKQVIQRMHRIIMGVTDPKIQVDHRDRIHTLDNRETNLRAATHGQNQQNAALRKNSTSGFTGVSWFKPGAHPWRSYIGVNAELTHLGYFSTAVEAAAAYNFAATCLHGEFAVLNDLSKVTHVQ